MAATTTSVKQHFSDFHTLVHSNGPAIKEHVMKSWENVNFADTEPRIVFDYLTSPGKGTDYLNTHVAPLLSTGGCVVKFASVFLHAKPMVRGLTRWGELPKKCELGDLQIVFLYLAVDKSVCTARSIIFQAKKRAGVTGHVIEHEEQRALYDECHRFRYESVLSGAHRTLPSGTDRERALQYLFMGDKNVRIHTIPSIIGEGVFVDFGELFLRLLNNTSGLEFSQRAPEQADDWNQIVWDMIGHIANTQFGTSERNAGLKSMLTHFNDFEDKTVYCHHDCGNEGPAENDGFGTLLVISSDEDIDTYPQAEKVVPKKPIGPSTSRKFKRHEERIKDLLGLEENDRRKHIQRQEQPPETGATASA